MRYLSTVSCAGVWLETRRGYLEQSGISICEIGCLDHFSQPEYVQAAMRHGAPSAAACRRPVLYGDSMGLPHMQMCGVATHPLRRFPPSLQGVASLSAAVGGQNDAVFGQGGYPSQEMICPRRRGRRVGVAVCWMCIERLPYDWNITCCGTCFCDMDCFSSSVRASCCATTQPAATDAVDAYHPPSMTRHVRK